MSHRIILIAHVFPEALMDSDLRRNSALLKLDLYCRGTRVDESCHVEDAGGRPILRTRAGLGSGLELVLPGNIYVNAPVLESWVEGTPYSVHKENKRYAIRKDGEFICYCQICERPAFYDQKTSSGKLMSSIGVMQDKGQRRAGRGYRSGRR